MCSTGLHDSRVSLCSPDSKCERKSSDFYRHLPNRVAARAWRQYMTPWKAKGATLVSPSITQGDVGEKWLTDFLNLCPPSECKVDAISLHWYEGAHQIEYFKKYFTDAHNNPAFQKLPIYVTEFAPTAGTPQEKATFIREAVAWMNRQDFILGYAVSLDTSSVGFGILAESSESSAPLGRRCDDWRCHQ